MSTRGWVASPTPLTGLLSPTNGQIDAVSQLPTPQPVPAKQAHRLSLTFLRRGGSNSDKDSKLMSQTGLHQAPVTSGAQQGSYFSEKASHGVSRSESRTGSRGGEKMATNGFGSIDHGLYNADDDRPATRQSEYSENPSIVSKSVVGSVKKRFSFIGSMGRKPSKSSVRSPDGGGQIIEE